MSISGAQGVELVAGRRADYFAAMAPLRTLKNQIRALGRYARRQLALKPIRMSRDPAFDPATTAWFRERIAASGAYLEYGGGASTLLAADAGVATVSVESDARFAAALRHALPPSSNVTVLSPDIGVTEDWGYPVWIVPVRFWLTRWRRYPQGGIAALGALPAFPDLVLVDGRFRRACALHVASAARARGAVCDILFDDYAGRPHYHGIESVLGTPEMIGRAALFRSDLASAIAPAAIAEAERDFR